MKYGATIDNIGTKKIFPNAYETIIPSIILFSFIKCINVFFISINEFLTNSKDNNLSLLL